MLICRAAMLATLVVLLLGSTKASLAGKITTDPNLTRAQDQRALAASDPRLSQKITYHVQHRAVCLILQDLSELSGVELSAGANKNDWPVRDRKMNVFVRETELSDLMNSIARVMKFKWTASQELKPPVYRLLVDGKAAAAADKLATRGRELSEALWQSRRTEWVNTIERYGKLPPQDYTKLRESDPIPSEYVRRGALQAIYALFEDVPETRSRYLAGRPFRISLDELDYNTKELCFHAGNELWKYLQRVGFICAPTKDPQGYGEDLKMEEKIDVCFHRLDVESFTPNLRWGSGSIGDTGYFHFMKGDQDYEIAGLPSLDSAWDRFRSKAHNRVMDGDDLDRCWEGDEEPHRNLTEYLKKKEEEFYPSEALAKHLPSPMLERKIKLDLSHPESKDSRIPEYIGAFQKQLAQSASVGVVADSWFDLDDGKLPDQEVTVGELLEAFGKEFNYNWDNSGPILEFRHRKWWRKRLNQIPDEWVAVWSENTRKNQLLSLEDISQIASKLSYYQAEECLRPDKVLGDGGLYKRILAILDRNGNLRWLRLYASLSSSMRTLLTEKNGVNGFMLTQDQWKLAQDMFDRIDTDRGDALLRLEMIPQEAGPLFVFKEINTDTGEDDRVWFGRLPKYTPPAETSEKKQ